MNFLKHYKLTIYLIAAAILVSCSTTRVIPEGQSRLKSNRIIIENSKDFEASSLQPYLKQKPNSSFIFGWNPFLNIYNWGNGKDNGWNRFVTKLGQAPVIYDYALVESSKKNIRNHLISRGYYNSIVKSNVFTRKKKTSVFYKIYLGKQYPIDNITYSISDTTLAREFYADTANSIIKTGDILAENRLEEESQRAEFYLRNKGYYGFSKNYFFFEADTLQRNGKASLNIKIADYTRNEQPKDARVHTKYTFGDVYIRPARNINSNMSIFRPLDSGNADTTITAYRNFFKPDTTLYKDIHIIGNGKLLLRKRFMSRFNQIKPGTPYNEESVSNTYRRFTNLGLFNSVNVQLEEEDSSKVKTNIILSANALQGYKLNLEASTNSDGLFGISPTLSYYHKNIFRGGETFTISLMGDFQFKFNSNIRSTEFGASTTLSIPNFLLLPDSWFHSTLAPKTEVSISYNFQDRPEYERNMISASYGYSWSSRNRLFLKINPIQLNIVKLSNLSSSFFESLKDPFLRNSYQDHFDFGLGANLYYTTDASANPSRSYFYLRWQNDLAGNLLSLFNGSLSKNESGEHLIWGSPYSQYYRGEISAVYTWKFGKKNNHAIAARFLFGGGKGYGNSKALPFEKLFWAGGAYSLRAWQARTVGPGSAPRDTTFSIPNQTGDLRLEANIEYRFPIFWSFDGAIFVDAGNVWNIERSEDGVFKFNSFYKQIAADWGLGLRLNLGFALLRLDWGMKIYDPAENLWIGPKKWFKSNNYAIQFGVGYPF